MSYRDRKDDRRRETGHEPSYSSSRRGLGSGRERERVNDHHSGRPERRRSRSASPRRRVDDRDRRDDRTRDKKRSRSRSRSPREDHRSRDHEHDPRRRDERRGQGSERKPDDRQDRRRNSPERNLRRGEGSAVKPEQQEGAMALDSKEPITAEDVKEEDMMAMMGFAGFGTTKGQAVEGNQEGAVKINQQRTWRQYMNRKGGFNRPLEKVK